MIMIRCLIVEDEKSSQELLLSRINKAFPEITVVGAMASVGEAVDFLKRNRVEILFLDNQIKGGMGLDILAQVPSCADSEVIFTTAYSEYAVEALNAGATHYLLKPYSEKEFEQAVHKAFSRIHLKKGSLVIGQQGSKRILSLDSLIYIKSEGAYTLFIMQDGSQETSSRNLGFFERRLPGERFFRIHHSYIVNLNFVAELERGESPNILLTDGETRLPVSQRRAKAFFERINML